MTKTEIAKAALELPVGDQLDVAQQLWDNVAPETDFEPTPELATLLEERLAEVKANPDGGIPVDESHARIRKSFKNREA